jgi:hypothetical protein
MKKFKALEGEGAATEMNAGVGDKLRKGKKCYVI